MHRLPLRIGVLAAAMALAGCQTVNETASSWYNSAKGVFTDSGSDQSFFAREAGGGIDEADSILISHEAAMALETAPAGATVRWRNPDTGVKASFTPGEAVMEEREIPLVRARNVETVALSTLLGRTYASQHTANLRKGPSTKDSIVGRLKKGETFTAIGKVVGVDWIMVGRDGHAVGYVYAPLVAPATTAQIATELRESPADTSGQLQAHLVRHSVIVDTPCRAVSFSVTTNDGATTDKQFRACKAGDGAWEIMGRAVANLPD